VAEEGIWMAEEKGINFKVSPDIYKQIKVKVAMTDTTIKDYILSLVLKDLATDKK